MIFWIWLERFDLIWGRQEVIEVFLEVINQFKIHKVNIFVLSVWWVSNLIPKKTKKFEFEIFLGHLVRNQK